MKEINDERIDTLFKAVLELKTVDECRRFFTDLCTISELKSMSQRMEVALMLKDKNIYTDIAAKTGFDISTISRVVNSKYIETHFGIFPLKYFFSEGLENQQGEEVSTRELKKVLQECVEKEDKHKPLTDDELVSIMNEKGYKVARRTIAKYREQLGIPKARLRKEL